MSTDDKVRRIIGTAPAAPPDTPVDVWLHIPGFPDHLVKYGSAL